MVATGRSTINPAVPGTNDPLASAPIRTAIALAAQTDINNVINMFQGPAPPTNPLQNCLWMDNSVNPNILKSWDGTTWIPTAYYDRVAHTVTPILTSQLTEDQGGTGGYARYLPITNWVKSVTVVAQPGSPVVGDRYVLPSTPTGANWSGNGHKVAEFATLNTGLTGWLFSGTPPLGAFYFAQDTGLPWGADGAGNLKTSLSVRTSNPAYGTPQLAAAAVATLTDATLVVDSDYTFTADDNTTFANMKVSFEGGIWTHTTHQLTIGKLIADPYRQCFAATDTGIVTLTSAQHVSVCWFGAQLKGTDDTNAVQQAYNTLTQNLSGGMLYTPAGGGCQIGNPGIVPRGYQGTQTPVPIVLMGDGKLASVWYEAMTSGTLFTFGTGTQTPDGLNRIDGCAMRNMGVISRATWASQVGASRMIDCEFARAFYMADCRFYGGVGTQLYGARFQDSRITGNLFSGYFDGTSDGTYFAHYFTPNGITLGTDIFGAAGQVAAIYANTVRDFRTAARTGVAITTSTAVGQEHFIELNTIENCDIGVDVETNRLSVCDNEFESGAFTPIPSAANNTGNGSLTADPSTPVLVGAITGPYRVVCTTAGGAGVAVFTVYDPMRRVVGTYTDGAAAFANQIKFTTAAGGTAWALNDYKIVLVTALYPGTVAVAGGKNTGNGTLTMQYVNGASPITFSAGPIFAVGVSGYYVLRCTSTSGGGQFAMTDGLGAVVGTAAVGTPFVVDANNGREFHITMNAGGVAFAVGDVFIIDCYTDTLIKIRNTDTITITGNSMSMQGVTNSAFMDVDSYSDINFGNDNRILNVGGVSRNIGYALFLGPTNNGNRMSTIRGVRGQIFDPRTHIYRAPGLLDGKWRIEDCTEGWNPTPGVDIAMNGATVVDISNLDEIIIDNPSGITITNFLGGYIGKRIVVTLGGNETLSQTAANFYLPEGADQQYDKGTRLIATGRTPVNGSLVPIQNAAPDWHFERLPQAAQRATITTGTVTLSQFDEFVYLAPGANITINPPPIPRGNQHLLIKDISGGAASHTVTFTGTVDGAASPTLPDGYTDWNMYWNGSSWSQGN